MPAISPLGHEHLLLTSDDNFTTYFFLQHENAGVFPGKMCSGRRKNHGCGQKNQKALALLYLASKPLRKAANSSGVPTEFATEPTRQI